MITHGQFWEFSHLTNTMQFKHYYNLHFTKDNTPAQPHTSGSECTPGLLATIGQIQVTKAKDKDVPLVDTIQGKFT